MLGVLVAARPAFPSSDSQQGEDRVWYWFEDCTDGKTIGFNLSLDGKIIRHLEFLACPMERTDKRGTHEESFFIVGGHTFQDEYHTKSTDKITVDIWEAGADPGDLILGIAFTAKEQILLNTAHIVKLDKVSRFDLDRGLVARSYPLNVKAPSTKGSR